MQLFKILKSLSFTFITLIGAILFVNIISTMSTVWDNKKLISKSDDSSISRNKWNFKQLEGNNPIDDNFGQETYLDKLVALIKSHSRPEKSLRSEINPKLSAFIDQSDLFENQKKRQIRYHQCYFNPISCFKKKK